MLKRNLKVHSHLPRRGNSRSPIATATHCVAATAVSLPDLGEGIPAQFTILSGGTEVPEAATALLNAGIIKPHHWTGRVESTVCNAITDLAHTVRPHPVAALH